jgi:hypothetical protein
MRKIISKGWVSKKMNLTNDQLKRLYSLYVCPTKFSIPLDTYLVSRSLVDNQLRITDRGRYVIEKLSVRSKIDLISDILPNSSFDPFPFPVDYHKLLQELDKHLKSIPLAEFSEYLTGDNEYVRRVASTVFDYKERCEVCLVSL